MEDRLVDTGMSPESFYFELCSLLWPMYPPTFSDFQLLILHVVNLGYGIVSRDDNPL
jgi:hypothetical protein